MTFLNSTLDYKFIGQFVLIAVYFFDNYLNLRQYVKARKKVMPEMLKSIKELNISQKEFDEIKIYTAEKFAFKIIKNTFGTFIILFLFQVDYFAILWMYLYSLLGNLYATILAFTAIDTLRSTLIDIPFSYYATFYLEEKYGFNKTTRSTFVTDIIKKFFLGIILGGLFYWLLAWVMEVFQDNFVFYAWIVISVFAILILILYPSVIAPLFNKFTYLSEENEKEKEVKNKIEKLSEELNFPLGSIYKMDGSKRSAHSQAYFFGILHKKQIVVYDTLIEKLEVDEIVAVVCHELGHWFHMHNVQMIAFQLSYIGVILYVFSFFFNNPKLYYDYGFDNIYYFMGFLLFNNFFTPIGILIQAVFCYTSRKNEHQADFFSLKEKKGDNLIKGLIRLFKTSKVDMDPDHLYSLFNNTHPTLYERIKALKLRMRKKD